MEWLKDSTPFDDDKLALLSIETRDFQLAVPDVQPSAKREGFATVPDVTWDDVGALETIREELSIAILVIINFVSDRQRLIFFSSDQCQIRETGFTYYVSFAC